MVFIAWLSAMAYSFTQTALMSLRVHEAKAEAQESALLGVDFVARDVRSSGYSAGFGNVTAIRTATLERLEVASDLNGDGDTLDTNESSTFSYDPRKRQLMRASGSGSPQPLVSDVPAGGLRFTYFDASGAALGDSSGAVTGADRNRIRRVDVRLRVEVANPDPSVLAPLVSTMTLSACRRNP